MLEEESSMKVLRTDFYFIIILSVSLLSYQYRTDGFFMEDAPFCFPISLPTSLLLAVKELSRLYCAFYS